MNHFIVLLNGLDCTVRGYILRDKRRVKNLGAIRIYSKSLHEENLLMLRTKSTEGSLSDIRILGGIGSKGVCMSFTLSS
jgi:hypothetical protein